LKEVARQNIDRKGCVVCDWKYRYTLCNLFKLQVKTFNWLETEGLC